MIAELHQRIHPDSWREKVGFSPELEAANRELFHATAENCKSVLNEWLGAGRNQPCLFGKTAAKLELISYCILTEHDLSGSDEATREKIQAARTEWTHEGFWGRKSAFVILAVSRRIAYGLPDSTVKELAKRLCSLYLLEDVEEDRVHLDEPFLEMPGIRNTTWKWKAGVNYFSAQGDRRWWHDHRIPGGMALSVNSVGHMVKSGRLAAGMKQLEKALAAPEEGWDASVIDSLEKALGLAMRTINNAADAVSGKATELLPLPPDPQAMSVQRCPFKLPSDMGERNFCEYAGHYHTDYTVPSEYFVPDIERPPWVRQHSLDFTYLFHPHVENPSFVTMGEGQPIRTDDVGCEDAASGKDRKAYEDTGIISDIPRLLRALSR